MWCKSIPFVIYCQPLPYNSFCLHSLPPQSLCQALYLSVSLPAFNLKGHFCEYISRISRISVQVFYIIYTILAIYAMSNEQSNAFEIKHGRCRFWHANCLRRIHFRWLPSCLPSVLPHHNIGIRWLLILT